MRKLIVAAFAASILVAASLLAQRALRWTSVDVEARLEADGSLRVRERQAYVFDGDWNGGERTFRLEPGQELELHGITRVDPATGTETPLTEGSLSFVDEYAFTDAKTLRWRSRLADDPPFSSASITYVLDYTLRNILVRKGDGFLLDHEFLFSDRSGPIERFTLALEIDPAWRAAQQTLRREIAPVSGGEDALVRLPLEYVGSGAPAARADRRPRQATLLGLIALGALISWIVFARRETRLGRFEPLPEVDRAWIETNLLPIRAEVAGAAWDYSVSQSEVAAMLARLVAEKKIETMTIGTEAKPELHLTLKVPREELSGYERELVDKFFFSGNTTSTDAIKSHYESSGFNPASVITPAVTAEMDALLGGGGKTRGTAGCLLGLAVLALLGVAIAVMPGDRKPVAIVPAIVLFILFVVASILANYWTSRADYRRTAAFWLLVVPWAAMAAVVGVLTILFAPPLVEALFAAAAICGVVATASVAASKRSREAIEFRRKLAAVRTYFKRELALERPHLEDAWFPYVLAFGLGTEAEKWFKAFGPAGASAAGIAHSTSSSSSGGSHGPGWTGGGGAFGGAGATGTWVAAASGMAAGVASPSSSSSGGGGGGGSSGGGGGGGW